MADKLEILRKRALAAVDELPDDSPGAALKAADEATGKVKETPGRLGTDPARRAAVRQVVKDMGPLGEFAAEVAPSLAGTAIGGAIGSAIPPFGAWTVPGATAGGVLGEIFGQEAGITPESDLAMGLAAIPLAGPVAGEASRIVRRGVASGIETIPSVQAALGRLERQRASGQLESFGTQIIGARQGVDAHTADRLYAMARETGGTVPVESLTETLKTIGKTTKTFEKFKAIPEAAAAVKAMDSTLTGLLSGGMDIGMDDLIVLHKLMNNMAMSAPTDKAAGKASQEVFDALNRDMERIGRGGNKGARFIKHAYERGRLEVSIQTVERKIASYTKVLPGTDDTVVDVGGLRQWFADATNANSPNYDANVAEKLKADLPAIKQTLEKWSKYSENSDNPAGPGSIVIRSIGARTGAGVAGWFLGGPWMAGAGAVLGSRLPEGMTNILMSKHARAWMGAAINMGKGTVNQQRWAFGMQLAQKLVTTQHVRAVEEQESVGQ